MNEYSPKENAEFEADRARTKKEHESFISNEERQQRKRELTKKRAQILKKLSPQEQEELAQIDLEWDALKTEEKN